MAGGRGTRFAGSGEKPLFEVGGRPMIDRVLAALDGSRIETSYGVVSPLVPETAAHLEGLSVETIETPGDGYVSDLDRAIDRVGRPALTAAADLPLLEGDAVDRVLEAHDAGSLAVCVPVAVKRALGASVDTTLAGDGADLAPSGVNLVGAGPESTYTTYDVRFAVNVNRRSDAELAEALL